MCYKVDCPSCGKATWKGCGLHIKSALQGIDKNDRCPNWKKGVSRGCISSTTTSSNNDSFTDRSTGEKQPQASKALKITCYGSASPSTPQSYLNEAYTLGSTLAQRGHTCLNGAGYTGCMGHLNRGACDNNGRIEGVLHDMFFTIDSKTGKRVEDLREFFPPSRKENVDVVFAKGDDLQERKRLLLDGSHGLIVLPGGPGTWDELCEMICAKGLGLNTLPIVIINVDGYYDSFLSMMDRCYNDTLMKAAPQELVTFVSCALDAVLFIETYVSDRKKKGIPCSDSVIALPPSVTMWGRSVSFLSSTFSYKAGNDKDSYFSGKGNYKKMVLPMTGMFAFGVTVGFAFTTLSSGRR